MYYGTNTTGRTSYAIGAILPTTSVINNGGYFSNTTFTVPYACHVKVSASATMEASSTTPISVAVYKGNNEQYQMFYISSGYSYQSSSGMHIMYCAAHDALTIKAKQPGMFFSINYSFEIL